MLLIGARITNYRSATDSGNLAIEPDVTCLVGKNESGKTALLQAMYKNHPVDPSAKYDETVDFPTALSRQRRQWARDEQIPVSTLTFRFHEREITAIENELGAGVLGCDEFTVTAGFRSSAHIQVQVNETAAVAHLRATLDTPLSPYPEVTQAGTIAELYEALTTVDGPPGSFSKLAAMIEDWPERRLDQRIITEYVQGRLPRLAYFADYDAMPGTVSIPHLIRRRDAGELSRGERALLSLLTLADIQPEAFCEADQHEQLIRDLEGVANSISDEVFTFWSQSDQLDVTLAIRPAVEHSPWPLNEGPILQIRLRDRRHRASVPFDERSRGFVWFFSFLAYVTELERADQDMILLLDEPGLYLHGRAQQDLLRLVSERLAPRHQVIYTTHSPFMVFPDQLNRLRIVTDHADGGTSVSADINRADADTLAPLTTAIAAELSRTLLTAEHTLLVSHPSDLIHLDILSSVLEVRGRRGLDPRWTPSPIGGAHALAALRTLLRTDHLDAVILADGEKRKESRFTDPHSLVEIGEFVGGGPADIEDLYEPDFYLALVSHAYADQLPGPITTADLGPSGSRIVRRVSDFFADNDIAGGEFNRFHTAATLLRVQSAFLPEIDPITLARTERLFSRLNSMLP